MRILIVISVCLLRVFGLLGGGDEWQFRSVKAFDAYNVDATAGRAPDGASVQLTSTAASLGGVVVFKTLQSDAPNATVSFLWACSWRAFDRPPANPSLCAVGVARGRFNRSRDQDWKGSSTQVYNNASTSVLTQELFEPVFGFRQTTLSFNATGDFTIFVKSHDAHDSTSYNLTVQTITLTVPGESTVSWRGVVTSSLERRGIPGEYGLLSWPSTVVSLVPFTLPSTAFSASLTSATSAASLLEPSRPFIQPELTSVSETLIPTDLSISSTSIGSAVDAVAIGAGVGGGIVALIVLIGVGSLLSRHCRKPEHAVEPEMRSAVYQEVPSTRDVPNSYGDLRVSTNTYEDLRLSANK
jgi:hypothetical protein